MHWTYSTYRAALRFNGNTVALLTPDGRNAFTQDQIDPMLAALNALTEETSRDLAKRMKGEQA